MKKIKFLLFNVIIFMTMSCHTYNYHELGIDEKLWKFANEIIAEPLKIDSLRQLYPELYNENYIDKYFFDSISTNGLISFILENKLAKKVSDAKLALNGYSQMNLDKYYKSRMKYQELTKDQLYGFYLIWGKKALNFEFVRINNKYFIITIHEVIFPW